MSVVEIIPYEKKYQKDFKTLNEQWITRYFTLEDADRIALDNPQTYILDPGGHIFVALQSNTPVGVCALIKREDTKYPYELAKMAVADNAKGQGIGFMLGQAVIEKVRHLGARNIYLESNTSLTPAIRLYKKLGFQEVKGNKTPYDRCNIQMELQLY